MQSLLMIWLWWLKDVEGLALVILEVRQEKGEYANPRINPRMEPAIGAVQFPWLPPCRPRRLQQLPATAHDLTNIV